LCPEVDVSGHGTAVAGITAGNGAAGGGRYRGCAYLADLLIVKLGKSVRSSYPTTTQLMQAADWAVKYASKLGKPIAINLSFGNNYGAHDGSSLLEQFLNNLSELWKCSIVAGTGNEGGGGIHYQTKLSVTERTAADVPCRQETSGSGMAGSAAVCPSAELAVAPYETSLSVQLWKHFYDDFELSILPPSGTSRYVLSLFPGVQTAVLDRTKLLIYYGEPSPFQGKQEIFIQFLALDDFLSHGIWRFQLRPRKILEGTVSMWLPSREILNEGTRFLNPDENITLTIPSTAQRLISVAAFDELTGSPAAFSGRGYVAENGTSVVCYKPELAAPGVSIMVPGRENSYVIKSGTSMAAPFVTGTALLLMEWGMIQKNDPFLYGEKLKVFLISGTQKLPSFRNYPNVETGYGTLCAEKSIPGVLLRG
jgi:subtilisin family serine protease